MIDPSIQIVPSTLTNTDESYHSTVTVNKTTPDQLLSSALLHDENNLSELFPSQLKLNALTPVNASSLFWLT